MDTEDARVNYGGERESVEAGDTVTPGRGIAVFAEAFVVETVDLCDLSRLMIPPQKRNLPRKFPLQTQQQTQRFHRIMSPIYKIT
mmetsp:Transcript_7860/g.10510  ORF Transcript_7860/g.10510 Transcript_7860/m.10510 type:complete len:85 (-) Transcript_7860:400-654(-)